jgi:glycosyltransferase involved in cell wall biosynthesis
MNQNLISLSLVTHHLNGHQKVKTLLDFLSTLDAQQRAQFEIIIVDDCSTDAMIPEPEGLNLKAYRVTDDIPWNQAGARNLGCFMAASPWILFFDVDQLPTESCVALILEALAQLEKNSMYYFYVDDFVDSNLNIKMQVHPNTFLVHNHTFKIHGMYDEDFAGRYGFEDIYLPYVWESFGGQRKILGSSALFRDTQLKTPNLDRSSQVNHDLALKKINMGIQKPKDLIRFQWVVQTEY